MKIFLVKLNGTEAEVISENEEDALADRCIDLGYRSISDMSERTGIDYDKLWDSVEVREVGGA